MGGAVRLVQRLGRDLRVRGREHDDRLPRRAVGADAARASTPTPNAIVVDRHGARRRLRGWSARSASTCSAARSRLGIAAEVVASVGIGLALLLVFREQDFSILDRDARRRGAVGRLGRRRRCSPRSPSAAGCSSASTPASAPRRRRSDAARHVPRAIWIALLSVGALVILNAVAVDARASRPGRGRRRRGRRPGRAPRSSASFGSWSDKPFAAVVLVAFLACGMAAQALTARTIYSIARDDVLPGVAASCAASTGAGRRSARSSSTAVDRLPRAAARARTRRRSAA